MQYLNSRIIHTHDTQAEWEKKETFIPRAGEIIIYDVDDKFTYERFKIGDGVTTLKELPFTVEYIIESMLNMREKVIYADAGRITEYELQAPNDDDNNVSGVLV